MRYLLLGGSGFLGTNLARKLASRKGESVSVVCRHPEAAFGVKGVDGVSLVKADCRSGCDFRSLVKGSDVVVHMVSSVFPGTSNVNVPEELSDIVAAAELLEACMAEGVRRVVFLSSGGTVYGQGVPPFSEEDPVWPICTYGLQKVAIERLFRLYGHLGDLDWRVVRPSNPYGPFQNPDGGLGAVSSFVRAALAGEDIVVFGDGSVVRDFVYVDDVVDGLVKVIDYSGPYRVFNMGSGCGRSILEVAETVLSLIPSPSSIVFAEGREADVPESVLDMGRFRSEFGPLSRVSLEEGVLRTAAFQKRVSGRMGS